MTRTAIAIVLIATTAYAHADGSVGVLAGASVGKSASRMGNSVDSAVVATRLDIGWLTRPSLMVGVHLGMASKSDQNVDHFGDSGSTFTYRPLDVGASIIVGRNAFFGGWFGVQMGWQRKLCQYDVEGEMCGGYPREYIPPGVAVGAVVGVDLFSSGVHHVTLTGDFEVVPPGENRDFTYAQITAGLAYRLIWTP